MDNTQDNQASATDRIVRFIAFYLPQFHPIPENNTWWGKGFTEWTNVARSKPSFPGHQQPHIPADLGFYDLRSPDVRKAQADMALEYGVDGFCYWHYWFSGKRLLDRPFQDVLSSGEPDFPFCLAWANETWSRRWLGEEKEILIKQEYSEEDDYQHALWLSSAFRDRRYIRINGRPLFLIYRPKDLPNPEKTVNSFRRACIEEGLPLPYLVGIDAHSMNTDCRMLGFDETLSFMPQLSHLPDCMNDFTSEFKRQRNLKLGVNSAKLKLYDYTEAMDVMLSGSSTCRHPFIPSLFVGWDNTARRGENGIVLMNSSPEEFGRRLRSLVDSVQQRPPENRLVFINAWNEWAEGNHLEPDTRFGKQFLEQVRAVKSECTTSERDRGDSTESLRNGSRTISDIRAIAFLLPQFHPIPENDNWWGKGFTEWTTVSKAASLFPGHYQPHLPGELGFYDLRLPDVRKAQAQLAREHGISGFCYYHYWFNGKLLLERPLHDVLHSGEPDFPFCLCWANENWTRVWDGGEDQILIRQDYHDQDDRDHIRYLCEMFRDSRYIRVDDKPLFLVYRANRLPDPLKTTSIWREEASKLGIGELYLCRVESFPDEHTDPESLGFDASVEFQPDWTRLGPKLEDPIYKGLTVYRYPDVVRRMLDKPEPPYLRFPCVTPSWDNSPRRCERAVIFVESTPRKYEIWLRETVKRLQARSDKERIVFINAWNEWGEGNHLEPDIKNGRGYLEATKRALGQSLDPSETEKIDRSEYEAVAELLGTGRKDEAVAALHAVIASNPGHASAHHDLGTLLYRSKDVDKALAHLERADLLAPNNLGILRDLGDVYRETDRPLEEASVYERILTLCPDDGEALMGSGALLHRHGLLDDAHIFFTRALAADPGNSMARKKLDLLSRECGEKDTKPVQAAVDPLHIRLGMLKDIFNEKDIRQPKASIIIPVYNQLEYTIQCLDALREHTPMDLYEVIVVDNNSTDGTGKHLMGLNGEVKVVINEENRGFTIACNQGAYKARGRYLVFLNNDTMPLQGWLTKLLEPFDTSDDVAAVGSMLIYPDMKLQEAGGIVFNDGNAWNFGRGDNPNHARYNKLIEVDYCSGAALAVRKDLFEKLGGFDERYAPAYYEDTDLCFSLREKGYKVLFQPASRVIHFEGITAGVTTESGFKQYQVINREKFREKWAGRLRNQGPSPYEGAPNPFTADRIRRLAGFDSSNKIRSLEQVDHRDTGEQINFLIVDPYLPIYDRASGSFRLLQILKILANTPNVHVTFIARDGRHGSKYVRLLTSMGIEVHHTDAERLFSYNMSVLGTPIDFKKLLSQRHYHYAILCFYELAIQYLGDIRLYSPDTRIIIDTVDIHFLREMRQAELYSDEDLLSRARNTKKNEIDIYARADALITVTGQDAEAVRPFVPDKPIHVIPNIHPVHSGGRPFADRQGIVFIGNYNHPPNIDAVKYYLTEIHPLIRWKGLSIPVSIIGGNLPDEVIKLTSSCEEVTYTGWVPETGPYLDMARISIAPLRYGAGMKGKVGEALAAGLPVVTTPIGAEGMGLTHEHDVMIAHSSEEFADMIARLYRDSGLWERLSNNGLHFIKERYSIQAVAKQVQEIFHLPESSIESNVLEPVTGKALTSIIIPCFNQLEFTKKTLQSIEEHTSVPFELLLVDNGSTDGTGEYLRKYSEGRVDVHIITNDTNLGFAAANNQALLKARGDYILLLNNDVVVTEHWLSRLIGHLEKSPDIGMVGPLSNAVSGPQQVPKIPYDRSLKTMRKFARDLSLKNAGKTTEHMRLVGFCLLIRKEVLDIIGGLDEKYVSGNYEDDDLCLRSFIAGFKNIIAHDVFIHHFGSMTFKGNRIDHHTTMKNNIRHFSEKWKGLVEVSGSSYRVHLTHEKQLEILLGWGEERFSKGDVKTSVKIFQRVLELDRTNSQALNNLGVIQWQLGNPASAIQIFQNVLSINPKDPDALGNLLQATIETGKFDLLKPKLLDILKQAQPMNPDTVKLIDAHRGNA